jgi:hypothetical protein
MTELRAGGLQSGRYVFAMYGGPWGAFMDPRWLI